ncbi:MAG: serine/threonine protein kinase [Acidobacteria bacterium]|nr:serine/threonine protein kinase [Acidobacteriota bacterium]
MNVDELCMGCMTQRGAAETCPHCGFVEGTPVASLLHLPPRTLLHNQYVIGRVLGHGGFGITYIGWDTLLERKLAVKEYFPAGIAMRTSGTSTVSHYSGTQQKDYDYGLERYLEEARMLARFSSHPNILSVLNFFKENGTAYIVTEFLEGHTFQKHLEVAGERISFEETMQIMLPVLRALEDVHASGILHRDISPDNIHIGTSRAIKLLDFGAARIALGERSKNLSVILKEGYAPPEQYHSRGNQGPWTDVYASAATIYRAITGRHVPPALDRMAEDDLKPPIALGVAMSLREEEALMRALSFNAIDRFQSVREFRDALTLQEAPIQRLLGGLPLPGPGPSSSAEVPTVRASGVPPVNVPVSAAPLPASEKPKVPVWFWSVIGGVVVLAVLIALRPRTQEAPPEPKEPQPQVSLPVPVAPTGAPASTGAPPAPAVTTPPVDAPAAKAEEKSVEKAAPAPPPKPAGPSYAELLEKARNPELSALDQMTTLEQAIAVNPKLPEAYDLLAQNLLYRQNKPGEAEAQYRKAQEVGGYATFQVVYMTPGEMRPGRLSIGKVDSTFVDNQGMRSHTTKNELIEEVKTLRDAVPRLKMKMKMIVNQAGFQIKYRSGVGYHFLCTSGSKEVERDMILALFRNR